MAALPFKKDISISDLQEGVNRLFNQVWHGGVNLGPLDGQEWAPVLDLLEEPEHFVVKVAKLPEKQDPDDVVRRDPTALQRIVDGAAYLESSRHLTGGPESATLSTPTEGRTFMGYMINRRAVRHEKEGDAE